MGSFPIRHNGATYSSSGTSRRENITDWALAEFRRHYSDPSITKWDIFHYVYAVLHHPQYRERYAANLKRELPRIPFVGSDGMEIPTQPKEGCMGHPEAGGEGRDVSRQNTALDKTNSKQALDMTKENLRVFRALVEAGRRLADLHVNYEQQTEYPLQEIWKPGSKLNYRVEKMRLGKDKTSLMYNDDLTLSGIPPATFDYRLGNRSALDWIIDQYQISTDKRSGITNDPNREDDPGYILRLIKQVIYVSLETVKIVDALPLLFATADAAKA